MTQPNSNMSLKGICDWAEGSNGQRQNPPINQNINADMVDGMHYTDLKADWEAYANTHGGGGGGVVAMGLANFAGNGGYVTIGSAQGMITMPDTNYLVYVVPSADTDSRVGEYWVPEANKGTTSFRVYNDGSATTQFRWAVATRSSSTSTNNAAGGDLSGTYPNPTVAKIQGIPVSTTDPTDGQVLKYNGTSGKWEPGTDISGGGSTTPDFPDIVFSYGLRSESADALLTSVSSMSATFTVPAGVSAIKVLAIGEGGYGGYSWFDPVKGGGGGGTVFCNNFPVTPGDTYYLYAYSNAAFYKNEVYEYWTHPDTGVVYPINTSQNEFLYGIRANEGQDGNDGGAGGTGSFVKPSGVTATFTTRTGGSAVSGGAGGAGGTGAGGGATSAAAFPGGTGVGYGGGGGGGGAPTSGASYGLGGAGGVGGGDGGRGGSFDAYGLNGQDGILIGAGGSGGRDAMGALNPSLPGGGGGGGGGAFGGGGGGQVTGALGPNPWYGPGGGGSEVIIIRAVQGPDFT